MALTSFLFGKNPTPVNIADTLMIDATTKIVTSRSVKLTSSPIESGFNITDHAIMENLKLEIEGFVSERPLSSLASLIGGISGGLASKITHPLGGIGALGGAVLGSSVAAAITSGKTGTGLEEQIKNRSDLDTNFAKQKVFDYLLLVLEKREPFDMVTNFRKYTNLVMTNLEVPQEAKDGDSLRFTMSCEQIQVVNTDEIALPESVVVAAAAADAATKKKLAEAQASPASNNSAAFNIVNAITPVN